MSNSDTTSVKLDYTIENDELIYAKDKFDTAVTSALKKLCNFESFEHPIQLQNSKVNLVYPMDDDFVSLMKYIPNDKYVKQWLSRQYNLKPLSLAD